MVVYSNADAVELSVNDVPVASLTADRSAQMSCVFEDVALAPGVNLVTAVGTHGAEYVTDSVEWSVNTSGVNISGGRLQTGYVSSQGTRFGSYHFFTGGTGGSIEAGDVDGGVLEVGNTEDPMLYKLYRAGEFSYEIIGSAPRNAHPVSQP